jgi:rubrerythrin
MFQDIESKFLATLTATPTGREHLLSIAVAAEEGDEGAIFDQLADIITDPQLHRIVERHRDDEARHARLFRGCLERLDLTMHPIPDELSIIRQIAAMTGGFEGRNLTADDVMPTYAMLLAIEERGVQQFPGIADAFRPHDPETADVYLRVTRDERGHVRHCETIGRRYAPDERTWTQTVQTARAIEEQAFTEVAAANLTYCHDQGWLNIDELLNASTATPS